MKRSFAVVEKKLKNRVGKIFADMPLDWITFWQKHFLAHCLRSGFCLRSSYYYLFFFFGMSERTFKLGLHIITIYSFHISNPFLCVSGEAELYKKIHFKTCLNVAESEEDCLLQLLVTAGYKSLRHSSLRSGHQSILSPTDQATDTRH